MSGNGRVGPPSAHVLETEVDGQISLYNPHNESVTVLNETASDIWRLSDGEHTLAEMVELLASAYAVDPSTIAPEVEATVEQLVEAGFLPEPEAS